ncbi:bifunctional riboflavin kinase/FAD synthetase [candidate division KSB1 bacterium]|nr:bifunctional riboflavin kinase/FAD synthetase [candidate division KSB1 bacterium]
MEIITNLDQLSGLSGTIVTVGTFDGVHLGHQGVIQRLITQAWKNGSPSAVLTFSPHPQMVIKSRRRPIKILTSPEEKANYLKDAGVDKVVILPFDEKFARLKAEDFVREILVKRMGMKCIVLGPDHAFGRDRSGDTQMLKDLSQQYGFELDILDPVMTEGGRISSTKIRHLLEEGKVAQASAFLGRFYSLSGRVVKSEGRGRRLQFPTANFEPICPDKLIPGDGVYAVWVLYKGVKYKGVANIGRRPTFNGKDRTLEVHILDFDRNIYWETLTIEFVHYLRPERKFPSEDQLIEQMKKDRMAAKKILDEHS